MVDESTDNELKILHASFCDPYLLIIRDDKSAIVLQLDNKGELDELDGTENFSIKQWTAGSLHKRKDRQSHVQLYLVSTSGVLEVSLALSGIPAADRIRSSLCRTSQARPGWRPASDVYLKYCLPTLS